MIDQNDSNSDDEQPADATLHARVEADLDGFRGAMADAQEALDRAKADLADELTVRSKSLDRS